MNAAQLKALQATRAKVFRDLDQIRKKYGKAALPAFRRYLSLVAQRTKRQKEIAQLKRELTDLRKKGRVSA